MRYAPLEPRGKRISVRIIRQPSEYRWLHQPVIPARRGGAISMKSGTIICVVLLFFSMPLAGQEADHADSDKIKILALENAWNQAETSKDAKALDGLLASTLVYVDADGVLMDKAKFLASVKSSSVQFFHVVNE